MLTHPDTHGRIKKLQKDAEEIKEEFMTSKKIKNLFRSLLISI